MHTHPLRIRHVCVQPGDSCISHHLVSLSPSLSISEAIYLTLPFVIEGALTPQCQGMYLGAYHSSHVSRSFHTLQKVLELPSRFLQLLLSPTLLLSLHVARNDMRLPMLRTQAYTSFTINLQPTTGWHRFYYNLCNSIRQKTTNLATLRCTSTASIQPL